MAAFDPDKFLTEREKESDVQETAASAPSAFNPDEFLRGASGGSAAQPTAPFNPDVFLNAPTVPQEALSAPVPSAPGAAPAFYYSSPTGIPQLAGDLRAAAAAAKPVMMNAAGGAMERYMAAKSAKPLLDVIAVTTMPTVGLPPVPPMATYESARAAIEAGKGLFAGTKEMADYLTRFPADAANTLRPAVTTFTEALSEAEYKKFKDAADKSGIEKAIKNFKLPERLVDNPAVVDALKTMKSITPPSAAAQVAGPLARGALRLAGPAALAYDISEAYPYYEAAGAPGRLASGEIRQQLGQARRAMLNAPTPAPLSPQEAANLLASGDRRLIDIYGGVNKLVETAGQTTAQPETQNFIDRAMNTWRKYQGVPIR